MNMFIGLAIIIIGIVFLLENMGLISSSAWQLIWPCLLIVLGLCMIFKTSGFYCCKANEARTKRGEK